MVGRFICRSSSNSRTIVLHDPNIHIQVKSKQCARVLYLPRIRMHSRPKRNNHKCCCLSPPLTLPATSYTHTSRVPTPLHYLRKTHGRGERGGALIHDALSTFRHGQHWDVKYVCRFYPHLSRRRRHTYSDHYHGLTPWRSSWGMVLSFGHQVNRDAITNVD